MVTAMGQRHPVAAQIIDLLDQHNQSQATLGVRVAELEERGSVYTQPTVSGWLDKIDVQPPQRVFLIEQALGLKPGTLSRQLGFLPVDARSVRSVPEALAADVRLDEISRRILLGAYEQAIRNG